MFGIHENQRKSEILNFVFYHEIKIKIIFISIKIGGKCQRGILKYLLNIIFIILFVTSIVNVLTVHTVSHVSIFR